MSQQSLLDVERCALGAAILDPIGADKVCNLLVPEDFTHPAHRQVFAVLAALTRTRQPVDILTLSAAMSGGPPRAFLAGLLGAVTSAGHAGHHAALILAASKLRALRALCGEVAILAEQAALTTAAADEVVEHLRVKLDEVTSRTPGRAPIRLSEAEPELLDRIMSDDPTPTGCLTGFEDVDMGLGGLRDGEMIVLAARPGVGKSLLAANIAENLTLAENPRAVLFLSLEMSAAALYRRYLFARSGVPSGVAMRGFADEEQKARLKEAHTDLRRAPWYVHAEAGLTAPRAHALARRFKNKYGPCMVIVDYLQLMNGTGSNRTEQVTNLSAAMKGIAVDIDCPVLVLSQLNRQAADQRDRGGDTSVRIPTLSDLRDSGAIEQDADVVLLLARDVAKQEPHPVEFLIAKNRPGRIGRTQLLFDTEGPRFRSIARVEKWDGKM